MMYHEQNDTNVVTIIDDEEDSVSARPIFIIIMNQNSLWILHKEGKLLDHFPI